MGDFSSIPDSVVNPFVGAFIAGGPKRHPGEQQEDSGEIQAVHALMAQLKDEIQGLANQVQASQYDDGNQDSSYCKLR